MQTKQKNNLLTDYKTNLVIQNLYDTIYKECRPLHFSIDSNVFDKLDKFEEFLYNCERNNNIKIAGIIYRNKITIY